MEKLFSMTVEVCTRVQDISRQSGYVVGDFHYQCNQYVTNAPLLLDEIRQIQAKERLTEADKQIVKFRAIQFLTMSDQAESSAMNYIKIVNSQ